MAQEVAVRVVEDRARRYFLQSLEQLALVGGAMIERLPQLDAADEDKGLRCAGRHGVSEESKATGKWAKTAPRPSASPRISSRSPVSALTKRAPSSAGTTSAVSCQYSGPSGGASTPRRARSRGISVCGSEFSAPKWAMRAWNAVESSRKPCERVGSSTASAKAAIAAS